MNVNEIKEQCLKIVATAPAVYMTVIGEDGFPRTRAMLNLRNTKQYPKHIHLYAEHEEDFMVYVSTNTASRKKQEIEQNPQVGLYYSLPESFLGLSLIGRAEIVENPMTKSAVWVEGWEQYYQETGSPEDPDYTLLRIYPIEARGWLAGKVFQFKPGT
jgi:general stress protein 26